MRLHPDASRIRHLFRVPAGFEQLFARILWDSIRDTGSRVRRDQGQEPYRVWLVHDAEDALPVAATGGKLRVELLGVFCDCQPGWAHHWLCLYP